MNDFYPYKRRKVDFIDDVLLSCSLESILIRLQTLEQERNNCIPFTFFKTIYFCSKLCYEIKQENIVGNKIKNQLLQKIFILCNYKEQKQNNNNNEQQRFPGCMPCSLSKKNLNFIKENEYMMCEKSDGFRYFMICTTLNLASLQIENKEKEMTNNNNNTNIKNQNICFLLDRDMNIIVIQIGWIDQRIYDAGTILDGELVKIKDENTWKYRIFDVICIAGYKDIKNKTYKKRMEKCVDIVEKIYYPNIMDTFRIEIKHIYETTKIDILLNKIENNYFDHAIDGIIFVPNKDPVYLKGGTQQNLFKWKANIEHTIDFVIRKKTEMEYILYVMVQNFKPQEIEKKAHLVEDTKTKLLDLLPILSYEKKLIKFDDKKEIVVECKYYPQHDSWVPIKYRSDKKFPNGLKTLQNTLEVIKNPIAKKDLISFFK